MGLKVGFVLGRMKSGALGTGLAHRMWVLVCLELGGRFGLGEMHGADHKVHGADHEVHSPG